MIQVTGWHYNNDGIIKQIALVSIWYQKNNSIIKRMAPIRVWYELVSNITFHTYYHNNNYINYDKYKLCDVLAC